MNRVRNYQRELDRIIDESRTAGEAPTLFLHSCCAPCSSYVLEYLRAHFRLTVFYYNPNISPDAEYRKRVEEQRRLIAAYNAKPAAAGAENPAEGEAGADENRSYPIAVVEGDYEPERFAEIARGREQCPEGGERCFACYELRLRETAKRAASGGFDYFATTLTVSPLKNAAKLNEIGESLAAEYGVRWLPSDFKKKGGYQRSVELSREYGLYRQDYCGCVYSRAERERRKRELGGNDA